MTQTVVEERQRSLLDELDKKLVTILQIDARASASQRIKSLPGVREAEIHLATGMIKVDTKFDVYKISAMYA